MADSRFCRGLIIKVLYAEHPEWVPDALLRRSLDDLGCPVSEDQLSSELVYLRDWPEDGGGYVRLRERDVPGTHDKLRESRLSPRGVNLIEKLCAADPMITLD